MKKLFVRTVAAGVFVLLLTACDDGRAKKVAFNNALVKEMQAVVHEIEPKFKLIENFVSGATGKKSDAKKLLEQLKQVVDESVKAMDVHLNNIQKLDAPEGGEKFKQAAVDDFKAVKDFYQKDMGDFLKINLDHVNQQKLEADIEKLTAKSNELMKYDDALKAAQKAFAKEANLRIQ